MHKSIHDYILCEFVARGGRCNVREGDTREVGALAFLAIVPKLGCCKTYEPSTVARLSRCYKFARRSRQSSCIWTLLWRTVRLKERYQDPGPLLPCFIQSSFSRCFLLTGACTIHISCSYSPNTIDNADIHTRTAWRQSGVRVPLPYRSVSATCDRR